MVLKLDRMLFGLDPMKMFLLIPSKFIEQEGEGEGERAWSWLGNGKNDITDLKSKYKLLARY